MRKVSMPKLISLSVNRTKAILFQQFSVKKWVCLLFIALMAGALGGSGSFGDKKEMAKPEESQEQIQEKPKKEGEIKPLGGLEASYGKAEFVLMDSSSELSLSDSESVFKDTSFIIFLIVLLLPLAILFIWLSARFKFVWYKAIVKNDASIKAPFSAYAREGNSLFGFLAVIFLAALAIVGVVFVYFQGQSSQQGGGLAASIVFALGGLLFAAVFSLIMFAVDHLLVSIMAMDKSRLSSGLKKLLSVYQNNKKEMWFFVLVSLGLGIACAILGVLLLLLVVLGLLLSGGILFGIPYLLFSTLLKIEVLFYIYAVIAGIPFIAATVLLMLSAGLPFAVFFRNFSLYFISSLECEYSPLEIS